MPPTHSSLTDLKTCEAVRARDVALVLRCSYLEFLVPCALTRLGLSFLLFKRQELWMKLPFAELFGENAELLTLTATISC